MFSTFFFVVALIEVVDKIDTEKERDRFHFIFEQMNCTVCIASILLFRTLTLSHIIIYR